jgi:hypothetical protein
MLSSAPLTDKMNQVRFSLQIFSVLPYPDNSFDFFFEKSSCIRPGFIGLFKKSSCIQSKHINIQIFNQMSDHLVFITETGGKDNLTETCQLIPAAHYSEMSFQRLFEVYQIRFSDLFSISY